MAFQSVSTRAVLKGGVRKEFAWRVISDFNSYPSLVNTVQKVVVHERNEREGRSEWFVSLEDAPMRWMEKDYFDADNFGLRFESIDGDFEQINGTWKVEDFNSEGIELAYSLDYDLGIPVIEEVVGAVLKEKMKTTIENMVQSIVAQLHRSSHVEERVFKRTPIQAYNNIRLNGKDLRVRIINISQRGILFESRVDDCTEARLVIGDVSVIADVHSMGSSLKTRALFQKEITNEDVEHLAGYLTTNNQRSHARKAVGKNSVLRATNRTVLVHIVDISPSGMLIECFDHVDVLDEAFEVGGVAIAPRKKIFNAEDKTLRVQFAHTLDESDFSGFAEKLDPRTRPIEMQMT